MNSEQRKTRAGQNAGNSRKASGSSLTPLSTIPPPRLDQTAITQQLEGVYIVVAQIASPGPAPRYRRRFYASLKSAQQAVDRAVMNGRDAHLLIGRISIISGDPR